ncbi:MAG: hypothetical protein NTY09_07535 [bacterium]|nr:hypothetical protein [bacterium]
MFYRFIAVLALSITLFTSCSGGSVSVTSPSSDPSQPQISQDRNDSSRYLLGYYTISIDSETGAADIVPLRTTQFTANVLRILQPPANPVNLVSVQALDISHIAEGYIEVNFGIRHPIPGNPISRAFDLRGILISNGTKASVHDPTAIYADVDETRLVNADGYTRWWNAQEFTSFECLFGYTKGQMGFPVYPTATLNGYKYYSSAFDYDEPVWELDPASRGTFESGTAVLKRPMFIQFAMNCDKPDFTFNYAIDFSWDLPDKSGAPNYPVDSFPLTANMAEAYCVSVLQGESTAWYQDSTSSGGEINLGIRVYDWQAVADPKGVANEIDSIWLESPALNGPIDVMPTATVLPDGPTSSVFEVSLGNLTLTHSGEEEMLVFVETSDGIGYEPQIQGGENFDYPDAPLGSYVLTSVHIGTESSTVPAPVVISIDPNFAQSGDQLTDVIVQGRFFQDGAQVELRNADYGNIEFENEVMMGGGTQITCDLNLALVHNGIYDVAVINPDMQEGVLEDGFTVDCADGMHEYGGKYFLTGGLSWNFNCQRGDLAILEAGSHAGECVVKRDIDQFGDYTGYYVAFDPDIPGDTPATDYFSLPGRIDGSTNYVGMTAQIDQNPMNAQIGVVNGRMFDTVQIIDEDGVNVDSVVIETTSDAYPGKISVIPGMDFDKDGDLWIVTDLRGEWPGPPQEILPPVWQLRHYELQPSNPYYVENLADRLEINDDLTVTGTGGPVICNWVADIAISYAEDSLFVFANSSSGEIFVKYDISVSPPQWVANADLYPESMAFCPNPYSGTTRVDIEFDHSDLSVENCRLMVMYQTWDGSIHLHLMRIDTDFNILNDVVLGPNFGSWDNPHCMAINTDPDLRNMIMIDMDSAPPHNDFFYFPMPSEGW